MRGKSWGMDGKQAQPSDINCAIGHEEAQRSCWGRSSCSSARLCMALVALAWGAGAVAGLLGGTWEALGAFILTRTFHMALLRSQILANYAP